MPVIRIAEIPNAGPQAVGASTANIGVPRFGGMTVEPEVAQLTGAAALSDTSIRRGAQSMLTESLELDAFSAEAEAGVRMAKQISTLGYVAGQMAEQFGKAKDTADLARAETVMRAAFEKQQNEQLDLPVDKWEENWTRNLDQTRKALSEIKISNNAAAELAPSWDRWSELSSLQIRTQSRRKQIEGFQMDVDANAMMRIADDDLTGAFAIYDRAVKDGIFTPEEGKMRSAKIYDDQVRKAQEQNLDRLTASMNAEPEAMLPLFERRSRGEDVPELGDISPVQASSFADKTTSVLRGKMADADDAADQAVLTGAIRTKEELREKFPNLPERRLLAHEATMAQVFDASPEGWARVTAARPKIQGAIELYDPAQDDKEMTRYFEIKDRINREMPAGERAEFLEQLGTKRREGNKLPLAMRDAVALVDKLETQGFFGKADPKRLESNREDVRAEEARKLIDIGVKRQQIYDELMKWSKENPVDARDREKVIQQMKILVDPTAVDAANQAAREAMKSASRSTRVPAAVRNFGLQGVVPAFSVSAATRDQISRQSVPGARQVALDFNDASNSPTARGVEIVIPSNATAEEKQAAQAYTDELTAWFQSKGVDVPNRGVKNRTGKNKAVPRFHTEPFFAKDEAARQAIIDDATAAAERGEPSEYAQLLVRTLGRVPGINFIAPHESGKAAGAVSGDYNERDFARKYIIPSLELIQRRGMVASN